MPRPPDFHIKDSPYSPTRLPPPVPYTADDAVIIDNGSSSLKVGFSSHPEPYINQPNVYSKYRNKHGTYQLLFGSDTEYEASSRAGVKSTWEGDLLLNPDGLEWGLDYSFSRMFPAGTGTGTGTGIGNKRSSSSSSGTGSDLGKIERRIIMTERLGTPIHSRQITSELLFECYGVPSVVYGIDGLFAFGQLPGPAAVGPTPAAAAGTRTGNGHTGKGKAQEGIKDGLVINMGCWSTTIIPVSNGKGRMDRAKRIPWGGSNATDLTLKLAQLKYPNFPERVTLNQATYMYRETAYFATNYEEEIEKLGKPGEMSRMGKVVQFDYVLPETTSKTEEEVAAATERKNVMIDRLREQTAKKKIENALQRETTLNAYRALRASKESLEEDDYELALLNEGFETAEDLERAIKSVESAIKRSNKGNGEAEEEEDDVQTFPMVDIPDAELDDEGKKEKRKQRLLKSNYDARMRMKAEKRAEKERIAEEKRKDEEAREADPIAWANKLRQDHLATIERMKERKKKRQALTNRKTAAAQARMKTISSLANDTPPPKRRKKGAEEDDFGADDEDWAVYREIDGGEDSEAEAEDVEHVQALETALLRYDPTFSEEMTMEAQAQRHAALINAFIRSEQKFDPDDIAQAHQIHLNVERIRVPETWFQPSMAGVDSAGVAEVSGWLLNGFTPEERRRMMQCVYVTGGAAKTPNLADRLHRELTALLPAGEPLKIVTDWPGDSQTAAWRGMAKWASSAEARAAAVTKAEWSEKGGSYLKEHSWSNWVDET